MPELTSVTTHEPASPSHFTYCRLKPGSDLQQGDVLRKTTEIVELLKEVHPHYALESYTHFLVLTQSCDLVRRAKNQCKARYITLAAIRPLSLLVERQIQEMQSDPFKRQANICTTKQREALKVFLERLLNNNESDYFYLHEDAALGFPESQCAFLRLSISVRAYQHYDICLRSRLFSLTETFSHKLGWLVGNMYSRIDTVDWVPDNLSAVDFQNQISDILDGLVRFESEDKINAAKKELSDVEALDATALRERINAIVVPSKKDRTIDSVIRVLKEMEIVTDYKVIKQVKQRLTNDTDIAQILK